MKKLICPALLVCLFVGSGFAGHACGQEKSGAAEVDLLGNDGSGNFRTITAQLTRPAGKQRAFGSRAKDMALSPDGSVLCVQTKGGGWLLDAADPTKTVLDYNFSEGVSAWHGVAWHPQGDRVYCPTAKNVIWELVRNEDGKWKLGRKIAVKSGGKIDAMPLGIAIDGARNVAWVCFSRGNTLAELDLAEGKLLREIPTGGVCPYDVVLSPDGKSAWVSNYGGRLAQAGELTLQSAGTPVLVDARGISVSGTVSHLDLTAGKLVEQIPVGLHPAGMVADRDHQRLYVANANSDSVSVIDLSSDKVLQEWNVRPAASLPFGSLSTDLALSLDGKSLAVANAGNNALAILDTESGNMRGLIPTSRFPGAVVWTESHLYALNTLGGNGVATGSLSTIPAFDDTQLARWTDEAKTAARVPQTLRALERAEREKTVAAVPVPAKVGQPSTLRHVIYVIKENRTYDQVLGDLPRGNRDPKLCMYGYEITPNQHALAEQFVLLDNYYCSGIVSADGHQWATQGITSDYQEKDGQVWSRSYDFGTDALSIANCDFLWDAVLLSGLGFRNYGELEYPKLKSKGTWFDMHRIWQEGGKIEYEMNVPLKDLRKYTCPDFPGWEMRVPDGYRIDSFLREFREYEKQGSLPELMVVYLPQDHTSGSSRSAPTPRAHVAENDFAVGRLVEAVSQSKFWNDTVIFVNEDDPQNGTDHVDGHRSFCLVVSPWAKREQTVSRFYNQSSVLHTICRILGVPPMNQMVAQSPLMEECFSATPDLRPFKALPTKVPFDEPNGKISGLTPTQMQWCLDETSRQSFTLPDRIEDDVLNRILWTCAFPDRPYPAEFAGAHGRGLKALNLQISKDRVVDLDDLLGEDDDDEEEDEAMEAERRNEKSPSPVTK